MIQSLNQQANSGWGSLSCSSITISSTGRIIADYAGYRGGHGIYEGGECPIGSNGGGKGAINGGGGGYGGYGGIGKANSWDSVGYGGIAYGSIINPMDMGSGGGGANGGATGGTGGGSIRIFASGEFTNNGIITSNGSDGGYSPDGCGAGGGSGGSIFISANNFSGNGTIRANGGLGGSTYNGGGAGGRIAIYYATDNSAYTITAYCGNNDANCGGPGTIYKHCSSKPYGDVYISNNNKFGEMTYLFGQFDNITTEKNCTISGSTIDATTLNIDNNALFYSSGTVNITNLNLSNGATLYIQTGDFNINGTANINQAGILFVNSTMKVNNMVINSGGIVTHSIADTDFDITVNNNLTVNNGGQINVTGKGYHGGDGVSFINGEGSGGGTAAVNGGGAGYGGTGGTGRANSWDTIGSGGVSNGSMFSPVDLGSGGGVGNGNALGGAGGGKIKIIVDGTLTNNGIITANGSAGGHSDVLGNDGGGGSGGSVYIITDQFSGNGVISANGGNGNGGSGGGAGGRIAVYYKNSYFSGQPKTNAGACGNPLAQAGTVMLPAAPSPDSPNSISDTTVSHITNSNLIETIVKLTGKGMLDANGNITGSVNISTLTLITVKTGAFKDKGFVKGKWTAQLEGISYIGQIFGMVYLNPTDRTINIKGVMDGPIDGSIDGCLTETMTNSGTYDLLNATWTFRLTQSGGAISCGNIYLKGSINYESPQEYPNTYLNYLQTSAQGTLNGGYTGAINTVLTDVRIDDATKPCNGEGFCFMTYQWDAMTGQAYGYSKTISPTETDLKLLLNKPLFGTASGLLQTKPENKSMWLIITKLEIGAEPQADLKVELRGMDRVSPGQTVTYTAELKNEGFKVADNIMVVVDLPAEVQFISANGEWHYEKAGESDWVTYPGPAPERISWVVPNIPNMSVMKFEIQAKTRWWLEANTELNAEANLYGYDPK